MAMLFQSFDFELDDPAYVLRHKQTLTIKPNGFFIKARLRHGMTPTDIASRIGGSEQTSSPPRHMALQDDTGVPENGDSNGQPMTILYGSNSGTCETMADRLAHNASLHGYKVTRLECLDAALGNLPHDQPVVLIAPSYEGQPPDNAAKFVPWVESIRNTKELCNVQYAVFGCGNRDWPHTFHRIPKLLDDGLANAGAHRLVDVGLTDAATDDVFVVFDNWGEEVSPHKCPKRPELGIWLDQFSSF
jgi:cytochrome P450 / NADPH-cytochrome P450 reductase